MTRPVELLSWRVIETACGTTGESMIANDERHDLVTLASGRGLSQLWKTDHLLGTCGGSDPGGGLFPGLNGLRMWILVIPPDGDRSSTPMHATDTVDFGFVLRGTVALEMEDGSSSLLQPGDAFVQAATLHRWRNPGAESAVLGVVVIGATPAAHQGAPADNSDRSEHHPERADDDARND
jgi:mannose-6-phosphate isomerase-like protein (cupin superfamily)